MVHDSCDETQCKRRLYHSRKQWNWKGYARNVQIEVKYLGMILDSRLQRMRKWFAEVLQEKPMHKVMKEGPIITYGLVSWGKRTAHHKKYFRESVKISLHTHNRSNGDMSYISSRCNTGACVTFYRFWVSSKKNSGENGLN